MEDKKIELKLYRHKTYKDIYLIRNWNVCGGCEDTEFFSTTKSIFEAIENCNKRNEKDIEIECNDKLRWFPNNKTKTILSKEMDFDGYKGILKKEERLPIADFELIKLIPEQN